MVGNCPSHSVLRKKGRMDELVKLVSQKTGLPEDKSRLAVQTVLDYLKKKLPAPVASQIDTVLASGNVGNVAKGLGGMLGKK